MNQESTLHPNQNSLSGLLSGNSKLPLSKNDLSIAGNSFALLKKIPLQWPVILFLAGFSLLFLVAAGQDLPPVSTQLDLAIAVALFSLFGIPHGAVDHIIYLKQHQGLKPQQFHLRYLATIAANLTLWVFLPELGYLSFLLVSAFHLGESQFSHYKFRADKAKQVFQFLWGLSILSGMTFYNLDEIQFHMMADPSFAIFSGINNQVPAVILLILTSVATLFGLFWFRSSQQLSTSQFAIEIALIGLVHLALYLFPLVTGFTLYFITLHAFKVLREEFHFFKREKLAKNEAHFIKLLTPFSLVSIGGIVGLYFLAQTELFPQSFAYAFIILVSCITVPHAHVMHRFYLKK